MDQQSLDLASREILTLITPGYRPPPSYNTWLPWLPGMPPFSMSIVDAMRHDYQVKLAMAMKVVPIMKPQFGITGDPEVVEFIESELRSIWTSSITDITDALWYTRFGCEMVYKRADDGMVRFARMMPYHPRDFRVLTKDNEIAGLRVVASASTSGMADVDNFSKSMMADNSDGELSRAILFAPKCFAYVHDRKFGSFEGQSELEGAFAPWMEKVREGGAVPSRSLWFYKCAFDSGIIKHPDGMWQDPSNPLIQVPYRDIALKVGESIRNGATIAITSTMDANGHPTWDYIPASVNQGGDIILNLIDHLDGKINKGVGIPDDVIEQVSGTGSYAGRTIPFIAFLEAGTPTVRRICKELVRQVLMPLAQINFGEQRGKDWEITEAGVNSAQFLGEAKEGVGGAGKGASISGPGGGEGHGIPNDGDGDGIPNENGQAANRQPRLGVNQMSLIVDGSDGLTRSERENLTRFRRQFASSSVTFVREPRRAVLAVANGRTIQMSHADQPRDSSGRFKKGESAETGEREFSSTQFNLKDGIYPRKHGMPLLKIRDMVAKISDYDLAEAGREDESHVTVKFGIHDSKPDGVRDAVEGFGPVEITLGKTSFFSGEDYDVVKIDVYGRDLHKLNRLIRDSVECTDTFPDYKPHVTLAYVRKGLGKKYAGMDDVDGMELTFDEMVFSGKDRTKTMIGLMDRNDGDSDDDQTQMGQLGFSFDESDHPRDKSGEFAKKGSAGTGGGKSGGISDEPFQLKRESGKKTVIKNKKSQQVDLFAAGQNADGGKLTHSPADDFVKKQAESLPGQKTIEDAIKKSHVTESPAFKKWFGESKVVDKSGKPMVVYHGTESAGFSEFKLGSYFSESSHEANAYTEISDTDSDKTIRYQHIDDLPSEMKIPKTVRPAETTSDYYDESKPFQICVNGNTDRVYYQTDKTNPVGDPEIVILSGVKCSDTPVESGMGLKSEYPIVREETEDDEATSPRELNHGVYPVYLSIQNPINLPWNKANGLAKRMGASEEDIKSEIEKYIKAGYDGIETESDDGWVHLGKAIRQFIPFSPHQIKSAIGNRGTFDSSSQNVTMSQSESADSSDSEGRWITIGGHSDGGSATHVQISRSGKILKGPLALRGSNIARLGNKSPKLKPSREATAAHAKAQGKSARDLTHDEARKLGSPEHVAAHGHAKNHAKQFGVSTHDVLQNMPEALKYRQELHTQRELGKQRAVKLSGLTPSKISRTENAYRDYSTVEGFDTTARTVALEHPELGFDPDDTGTPAKVWELIKEGRKEYPKLHDEETARQAAEWVAAAKAASRKKIKSDHDDSEDTSFDFGFGSSDSGGFEADEMAGDSNPFMEFSQTSDGDMNEGAGE